MKKKYVYGIAAVACVLIGGTLAMIAGAYGVNIYAWLAIGIMTIGTICAMISNELDKR